MKKSVIFLTFTLFFSYFCVPYLCAQTGVTATVTPKFDEESFRLNNDTGLCLSDFKDVKDISIDAKSRK